MGGGGVTVVKDSQGRHDDPHGIEAVCRRLCVRKVAKVGSKYADGEGEAYSKPYLFPLREPFFFHH